MPEFETEVLTAAAAIEDILRDLAEAHPDIRGAAVVTAGGELVAARLPAYEDGLVEGLTAMLAGVAERAAAEMSVGTLDQVIVRASEGVAVLLGAGHERFLLVLATAEARLGIVLHDAARVASRIRDLSHTGEE